MTINTQDKVTFKGNGITLEGNTLSVGEVAPDFTVTRAPFTPVKNSDYAGKIRFISVTPSVDTGVCDLQMRALNQKMTETVGDMVVWNISVDTPFALKRYCGAAGIERVEALSDYKDHNFGLAFGIYMKELGLLARSVWILDQDGVVRYKQVVPEMTTEPDYDAALSALRSIAG
ncbi:MAG: thiol peroxidase [Myxococcales bacterium]|nr:thiol peroxidase [Myxococcales bacterium]